MKPIRKIKTSYTTQLTLWVAVFVLIISAMVIFLLARFSQDCINEESIETTQQTLENTALRVDNTLQQAEITAQLENQTLRVNRRLIEQQIDDNGYLVTIKQTLPNAKLFVTRRDSSQLSSFLIADDTGYRLVKNEDDESYVFYAAVGKRPFSIVVVAPTEDIFGKYTDVQYFILICGIAGVLVLLYILYAVIGYHLHPLHHLADSAQTIAEGNLETTFVDSRHKDEIGQLQNSLKKMQSSLADYMDEMQKKQAAMTLQNEELQGAYREAQAYEVLRTRHLHEMTDKMKEPIQQLCRSTDCISNEYRRMTKKEIALHESNIMQATETITQLLDQLFKNPAAL